MKYKSDCVSCSKVILNESAIEQSNKKYKLTLCAECERRDRRELHGATNYAIHLYYALKNRQLDVKLQHKEKYKTVDIYIPSAMLHIEVDGSHHNTSAEHAYRDLMRTFYSARDGYFTLRIPNSLVTYKLKKAIDIIVNISDILRERNRLNGMRKAS